MLLRVMCASDAPRLFEPIKPFDGLLAQDAANYFRVVIPVFGQLGYADFAATE